ncbi:MAG: acyl-ACP desaturase [Actinomycetota bacterium]|nr:acyl-ACP desaturase [Actinomycetota bacterium]
MDDPGRLEALAPVARTLFERHLERAREWFPHELIPWGQARDFVPGQEWDPDEFPLPDAVRSALIVNLLTEDNLPYYLHAVHSMYGSDDIWGEWNRRWTAEEHRHSIVLRDWLIVTRAVDPVALERARMTQVSTGFDGMRQGRGAIAGLVYVTLQELATRIAHRNTGRLLGDEPGAAINARVAADENLHFLFYRDLAAAAAELDPSEMVKAVDLEVRSFEMPGTGIDGFGAYASAIAGAGIYDFSVHYEHILVPVVLRAWGLDCLVGLDGEAEESRDRLMGYLERVRRVAERQADQRAAEQQRGLARSG